MCSYQREQDWIRCAVVTRKAVGCAGAGTWRPKTYHGEKDGDREEDGRWKEQRRKRGRKDDAISLLHFCLGLNWTQKRRLQVSIWFSFHEESTYTYFFKEVVNPNKSARGPLDELGKSLTFLSGEQIMP